MEQQKTVGMIFPITKEMLTILKERKKAILCKFTAQEIIPRKMKVGQKAVFYFSQHIIGEAEINKIELNSPLNILKKHIKNLLVTEKEFKDYVGVRSSKRMLLLELSKIKIYKKETNPVYPVPMSGRYMMEREYSLLNK